MHPLNESYRTIFSADDILATYIWVFYAAFILSFLFTPLMHAVANYYGIIDRPDLNRKIHKAPVAYLGGIAIFLGWMAGLAVSQFLPVHVSLPGTTEHVGVKFSIIIGACIIVLLGFWDDVRGLKPWMKIVGQTLAALALLLDDVGLQVMGPVLRPFDPRLHNWMGVGPVPDWVVYSSSIVVVLMLVVGCCNATNLLDGLDGLCGGVTSIISIGFLFLAVYLAMLNRSTNVNWDGLRVVIALALAGSILGFVPYNFNPASIFMGDAGSMFIGYACAVMIILLAREQPKWFLASMVMFALPVLDTALAFTRRWVNRRPIFSADRHHFHHQMVARGLTIRKTVLLSYILTIGFVLLGSAIVFMRARYAGAIYLLVFGSIIVAAYKMGMVHERTVVFNLEKPEAEPLADKTPIATSGNVLVLPNSSLPPSPGADDLATRGSRPIT